MPSYMVTTTLPEGADDALAVDAKSATVVTVMLGLPGPLGSMALENKDDYMPVGGAIVGGSNGDGTGTLTLAAGGIVSGSSHSDGTGTLTIG